MFWVRFLIEALSKYSRGEGMRRLRTAPEWPFIVLEVTFEMPIEVRRSGAEPSLVLFRSFWVSAEGFKASNSLCALKSMTRMFNDNRIIASMLSTELVAPDLISTLLVPAFTRIFLKLTVNLRRNWARRLYRARWRWKRRIRRILLALSHGSLRNDLQLSDWPAPRIPSNSWVIVVTVGGISQIELCWYFTEFRAMNLLAVLIDT